MMGMAAEHGFSESERRRLEKTRAWQEYADSRTQVAREEHLRDGFTGRYTVEEHWLDGALTRVRITDVAEPKGPPGSPRAADDDEG
jgi:hypothetical protein